MSNYPESNHPESNHPTPEPHESETTPTRTAPTTDAVGKQVEGRAARPDVPAIDPAQTQEQPEPSAQAKDKLAEQTQTALENVREGYR